LRIDGKEPPADWLAGMKSAAEHENVFCKVSALVEATGKRDGDAPRDVNFYKPVLDALWNIWGSKRLIYGSNWPVSVRAASYETLLGIVRDYFSAQPRAVQEQFFAGNAQTAYRWKKR
jgi:L-fuconolactonase